MNNDIERKAFDLYKPPFHHRLGYIYDADSRMVSDEAGGDGAARVRGWGRISYLDDAEDIQDAVGDHIAKAMTEYWNKGGGVE